jgi:hypothetical protein
MPTLPSFTSPLTASAKPRRPKPKRPAALPWPAHLITLAVLLLVYAAGYSGGRDAAPGRATPLGLDTKAHQNHPACHPNLKP